MQDLKKLASSLNTLDGRAKLRRENLRSRMSITNSRATSSQLSAIDETLAQQGINIDSFKTEMENADNTELSSIEVKPMSLPPNTDERSMLNYMLNEGVEKSLHILTGENVDSVIRIEDLWNINGLPPVPDNIVDPPVILQASDFGRDLNSWGSGIVGADYAQRVLARGQYLTLVPLEIQPIMTDTGSGGVLNSIFGAPQKAINTVERRMNVANYGLHSKVAGMKYHRAVQALMKTALISLGIDSGNMSSSQLETLSHYLPQPIVDGIIGNDWRTSSIVRQLAGSGNTGSSTGKDKLPDSTDESTGVKTISNLSSKDAYEAFLNGGEIAIVGDAEKNQIVKGASLSNLIRFITNVDSQDGALSTVPFSIFYCNGPIERSFGTSISIGESAVAQLTSDIGAKITEGAANMDKTGILQSGQDVMKELAYHNSGFFASFGSKMVANTYIPNLIKGAMLDMSYTVNIRDIAVSSDRYSLARLFYTLAQIMPFYTQTQEPDKQLIVPQSPLYCSAFCKGVMNLTRAAITNVQIKTAPEFQTPEGIPTEFDITLTITPLVQASTMPDFGKWYDGTQSKEFLIAAMYNPLSTFNIIATYAGQNTVLTNINQGFFEFFISGTAKNIWSNIKNTGKVISASWTDWMSSSSMVKRDIMVTSRFI